MLRMLVFFFLSPFLEEALPLTGDTDKCVPAGMLEDEAMLSIYNVLRVPDTRPRLIHAVKEMHKTLPFL